MAPLLTAQASNAFAPDFFEGELWAPFDPPVWQDPEIAGYEPADDEAILRIHLDIARRAFSYMLYGGTLEYVPSDLARGVAEEIRVAPNGLVAWGDPNLTQVEGTIDARQGALFSRFRYTLSQRQKAMLTPWLSGALSAAGGTGSVRWFWSTEVYTEGLDQALKEAVRAWLRVRHYNKPSLIRVRFRLRELPVHRVEGGSLLTSVKILMFPPEVRDYTEF